MLAAASALQLGIADAHTSSVGYENAGPGAVTFWYGTYHDPSETTYFEGSFALEGVNVSYSKTVSFTLLTATRPAGLVDGTTNFYSDGTKLVGSSDWTILTWQGVTFTGLSAGTYTFTYVPASSPTAVWAPIDSVILSSTVTLDASVVGPGIIDKSKPIFDEKDPAATSETITFDGGTFAPNTAATLSQPITVTELGGKVDTSNGNAVISGAISGTGSFTKTGNGTLYLTGTSTLSGGLNVDQGRLVVNGSAANSTVTISEGGILGGSGTIGGIAAQGGSVVAPGNSIGTLNVAGDVNLTASSVYQVEVNDAGQSDLIKASGKATIQDGTVQIVAEKGNYRPQTSYTILTATGGVTGRFAAIFTNLAFLMPELRYGSNAVTLTLTRNDITFQDIATTRNQSGVSEAVDQAINYGNPIYDVLIGATAEEARAGLDLLSGEVHASAATVALADSLLVQDAVLNRLRNDAGSPAPQGQPAQVKGASPAQSPASSNFFWGQGFGSWGQIDGNENVASVKHSTGGFIIGADTTLLDSYRIGIAGGFARTTFDVDARLASGSNDSVFGALYGSAEWGNLNLRLGASYSSHDIDTNRRVDIRSFSDRLDASYDGWTTQAFGELGYRFAVGAASLEPFAGASILRLHLDGFEENGGAAALTGLSQEYDLATTTIGLRAETRLSAEIPLIVRGLVGWRHAYGDVNPAALLAFRSGSPVFAVSGVPIDRDVFVTEAGLDWQATSDISLGVSYQGQIGSQAQDHALKGNFTWKF